jgi:hypothetical protein
MIDTPESPAPERTDFQKHYLEAVRGWHRFDLHRIGRDPSDNPVVDIDVAPPGGAKVYSRIEDVRSDLEDLAGDIPADEPDRELVAMTAAANVMFLRARAGEETDFEDYVEGTVGFRPAPLAADEIDASATRLDAILGYRGLRYASASREKFAKDFIQDTDVIRQAIAEALTEVKDRAGTFLQDPPELDLEPEYIRKDSLGVSALFMDYGRRLHWTVNLIPERNPLDLGRINTLTAHEITGHGYHFMSLGRSIRRGAVNPVLGVGGMHMPIAFQTEALAQHAESEFLDNSWPNVSRAILNEHVMMILYDAAWRVNHDEDPKAVFESIRREDRLPFEPEAFYGEDLLTALRDDPLYRTYIATYYPAAKALSPLRASEPETRQGAVDRLYDRALTPRQIADTALSA